MEIPKAIRNFSVMTEVMMVECKEIQKMKESIKKEETKEKYTYMSIEFFMAYIDFFLKGNAKSKYLEYLAYLDKWSGNLPEVVAGDDAIEILVGGN